MPKLTKNDPHQCPFFKFCSKRANLKRHLSTEGKKEPRCTGLCVVIPNDVFVKDILPHYTRDRKLPDLTMYTLKSPGRPKKQLKDIKHKNSKKRRISSEGFNVGKH